MFYSDEILGEAGTLLTGEEGNKRFPAVNNNKLGIFLIQAGAEFPGTPWRFPVQH